MYLGFMYSARLIIVLLVWTHVKVAKWSQLPSHRMGKCFRILSERERLVWEYTECGPREQRGRKKNPIKTIIIFMLIFTDPENSSPKMLLFMFKSEVIKYKTAYGHPVII